MTAKVILYNDEARTRLCHGLDVLANAVKLTLGPRGRTVVLERPGAAPLIINSGVVVAREITLREHQDNLGARLAREVSARTSEAAGDGTTTATVLAQAIVRQGMKYIAGGHDAMDLKRGIDAALARMVERLQSTARRLRTSQEIAQIATIAANGDAAIGALIVQALERVGHDGAIRAEDGHGMENVLEVVEGMQFDRGYISPYLITDPEKARAILDDACILLYKGTIDALGPLLPLLERIAAAGQPLLIVADDVAGEALATLVMNVMGGTLKACAVKAPGFGEQRQAMLEDLAVLTGTAVIGGETGASLRDISLEQLGRARRVEIERDGTTVIGGAGEAVRVHARVAQLREALARCSSEAERAQLAERIARLAGGVALLRVGASTEMEMKEKKSRVEDALHATRAAVEEGIGPGGGVALLRAREVLEDWQLPQVEQQPGVRILHRAVEEPLRQIVANAGGEPDVVLAAVTAARGDFGYDAAALAYGDMMSMGVIDPIKVTRLALANAVSVAGLLLTAGCTVAFGPEAEAEPAGMPL